MKRIICSMLAMSILAGSVGQAAADIIHLKTGEKLVGEVQDLGHEALHFKSENASSWDLKYQEIDKADVFVATDDEGIIIWPESLKGKLRISEPTSVLQFPEGPPMTPEDHQQYFMDQYLEQQRELNKTVGYIQVTMMVGLALAIAVGVIAATAN